MDNQLIETQKLLGEQIKALRESLGLSQEAFAKRCGWDRTRQSKIEGGKYNLTLQSFLAIANAANLTFKINFKINNQKGEIK